MAAQIAASETSTRPGEGLTVLLAEDNAANQRVVTRIIERLG
jgi:CheY-like chemotaxis protein